jgi:hypothetical protein
MITRVPTSVESLSPAWWSKRPINAFAILENTFATGATPFFLWISSRLALRLAWTCGEGVYHCLLWLPAKMRNYSSPPLTGLPKPQHAHVSYDMLSISLHYLPFHN